MTSSLALGLILGAACSTINPVAKLLEEIQAEALRLPPEDREILAGALLHSLDEERPGEIDEAWIAEAERRYERWIAGKTEGSPASIFSPICGAKIEMRLIYDGNAGIELARRSRLLEGPWG